ncbi:MAG: caspase family protein, partial [Treponemataceae bacterium]|nr:caspase family protein [Treponemataceae bacterium]
MNKILKFQLIFFVIICVFSINLFATENSESVAVERFALYVAANNGGKEREVLRYAASDAEKLKNTMQEIGGIDNKNSVILTEPNQVEVEKALQEFAKKVNLAKQTSRRTEFIFYYSGHSDENALLLGEESFGYSQLKSAINSVPSDIHVVMLDSCFSGNFIRAKGGTRQKSFLVDESSIVSGHAYLSSSSESEASQESDLIQSSFFTHALITGLRGAADSSGDNKVSLNELYYYAFNETLSQTEQST